MKLMRLALLNALIGFSIVIFHQKAWSFCFEEAGAMYDISPKLLKAIAMEESSLDRWAVNYSNINGSYDVCMMQINSGWHKVLGQDTWRALSDPCTCVKVGAWILAVNISRHGYTWEAVGYYNAISKKKRMRYIEKIKTRITENNELTE